GFDEFMNIVIDGAEEKKNGLGVVTWLPVVYSPTRFTRAKTSQNSQNLGVELNGL
ncbi:hypothetical protein BB560_004807, partial [Smittium megazygosporum]